MFGRFGRCLCVREPLYISPRAAACSSRSSQWVIMARPRMSVSPLRQRCAERNQKVCHPRAPGEPNPITKKELLKRPDIQRALDNSMSMDVPDVQDILCNMQCHVSRMEIHTYRHGAKRSQEAAAEKAAKAAKADAAAAAGSDTDDPDEEVTSSSQVFGVLKLRRKWPRRWRRKWPRRWPRRWCRWPIRPRKWPHRWQSRLQRRQPRRVRMLRSGAKC